MMNGAVREKASGHSGARAAVTLLLGVAVLLGGCTHGPPQLMVKVENARLDPGGRLIAVAVDYEKHRQPTGINAFPNGGVPRVLEKQARVYLCDLATLAVTRLAAIESSAPLRVSFSAWIAGWEGDAIILRLTGRAGTSLADYEKEPNEEVYRVALAGGATRIARVPQALLESPWDGKGAIQVGNGFDSVTVKRARRAEWVALFRIDPATGELVAFRDTRFGAWPQRAIPGAGFPGVLLRIFAWPALAERPCFFWQFSPFFSSLRASPAALPQAPRRQGAKFPAFRRSSSNLLKLMG